jgi:hypothetical protein
MCSVLEYYRKLWVTQSEDDTMLTVPNFNKAKLKRLGNQIGLSVGLVQRKMRVVLKKLKKELGGMEGAAGAKEVEENEGSFYSSRSTNAIG